MINERTKPESETAAPHPAEMKGFDTSGAYNKIVVVAGEPKARTLENPVRTSKQFEGVFVSSYPAKYDDIPLVVPRDSDRLT